MALFYFILLSVSCTASATISEITVEGEAFLVKCPLNGFVTWHFAKTDISISTDEGERVHSSGMKLWFLPTVPQDSGNYTCKNQAAPHETETVSVTIQPYNEGKCYYKDALYIESRGSLGSGKIACPTFSDYKNASDVKWYKDCKYLQGPKYYKTENGKLHISEANETDNGVYTCNFTYSHGGQTFSVSASRNFRIEALSWPKPIQVLYPKDDEVIKAKIGHSKNLSCKAWLGAGKQRMANSFWEFDHVEEFNNYVQTSKTWYTESEGQLTEATLTIKKVRKEDFNATFSCFLENDRGYKIVNISLRQKAPRKGHSNIPLVVGFFILFVAIAIVVMLYHFFRIDIVLLCRRIFSRTEFEDDGKVYDAYVICPTNHINATYENNFMSSFVHQILPEVLENQYGYKLCIYGRDVLPGEDTIVAVETRIKVSRRLIILITQALVQSRDFAYEHQIAFYNVLIQNSVKVILLEMERLGDAAPQLQESLRHIMSQQGTIKWKEKYMAHPFSPHSNFWKHVEYHMPVRRKHPPTYSFVYNVF